MLPGNRGGRYPIGAGSECLKLQARHDGYSGHRHQALVLAHKCGLCYSRGKLFDALLRD